MLALVGSVKSTQILAMSDAIKTYGVPTMIGGTNATLTKQGNPWLFRVRPDDSIAAAAMVKYIKEDTKFTKVGILHDTDAFGTGGADLVEQGAKDEGLTVVKREKYTTKDKDFTAQLLSLKNAGAQIMVLYGTNPEDVAVIQRQYRQLGSPFKYIGSPSSQMKDALNLSREAAEGLIAVADFVPGQSDVNKKYAEAYKKEYNEDYDSTSAWTYDGLNILTGRHQEGRRGPGQDPRGHPGHQGLQGGAGHVQLHPERRRPVRGERGPDREGSPEAVEDRQRRGEVVAPDCGSTRLTLAPRSIHRGARRIREAIRPWIWPPIFR